MRVRGWGAGGRPSQQPARPKFVPSLSVLGQYTPSGAGFSPLCGPNERLSTLVKVSDRHPQHMGDVEQPVGSLLIFLDLLEGYAQSISQQRLRHALSVPRFPDPFADL